MKNKTPSFVVLRILAVNGNTIEHARYFGSFTTRDEADAYAEKRSVEVESCPALRGISITFYVREEFVEEA
jgi:hypothetical protein